MQPPLSNDEELEQSLIQLKTFSLTHEEFEILENAIISKYLRDLDDARFWYFSICYAVQVCRAYLPAAVGRRF